MMVSQKILRMKVMIVVYLANEVVKKEVLVGLVVLIRKL